ncbi:hypothetical protein BC939DRAFT_475409 [Gamsiella multidivaricata]|uniref:uncharacterized protein n=1 Tax=Gamsiella multidivaricata TaxID=101098 RepID=UPI002220F225|nr:uncharacterized protein BC939DRAFT_475409 [Gamsiella multidivaricata]KAI7827034.1 hypothetical protein BC939DRAFT_475409 [Gamsiella multidivaricata]
MATLKLFCLVDGEPSSGAFPVDIAAANTVGDLKDAIKIKMTPKFDDIATAEKLWPTANTLDIFPDMPTKETVHIIIQRPPQVPPLLKKKWTVNGAIRFDEARKTTRLYRLAHELAEMGYPIPKDGSSLQHRHNQKEVERSYGEVDQCHEDHYCYIPQRPSSVYEASYGPKEQTGCKTVQRSTAPP